MTPPPGQTPAVRIVERLRTAGHVALLAGGCVRDLLLGASPKDFDVATDATPAQVVATFPRTRTVGAKFGVVLVRLGGVDVEVATFRSDGTYSDGRHPDKIEFSGPREDAQRRDFTINGMFYDPATREVIDYVGGQADLKAGVIRAIGEPQRRFAEDHLRMLRAVRFAARFGFEIESSTLAAIRTHAAELRGISAERIRQELDLILGHDSRARGWALLRAAGLDPYLIPGLEWDDESFARAYGRLEKLPPAISLSAALAAVVCEWEPRRLADICHEATYSNHVVRDIGWFVEHVPPLLSPDELELADVKLLLADVRCADLMELARAEYAVRHCPAEPLDRLAARMATIEPERVSPPRLLTGDDLIGWRVPKGPAYARVLEAVYRAQLNETISTREEAAALAQRLLGDSRST